ncbi:MAG: MFS transporter [Flavobacteriales bacterium]|nr:MFS transporter [Flavobacteriales bacterium]
MANHQHHFQTSFSTLILVFFFWGFVAASNGIFIPFCKSYFHLDQFESQLIDAAFYSAYFYGSLVLYLGSYFSQIDILNKIGYKNGIIIGLLISIVGAVGLAVISSMQHATFGLVLLSFFVIALGFSLQQTAAQPFAIALGKPETGAHRLNMAGGINSLGTLLGPLVVSFILFGDLKAGSHSATISSIKVLYIFLACLFTLVSIVFLKSKMPRVTSDEKIEKSPKALIVLLLIGAIFPAILFTDQIHSFLGLTKTTVVFGVLTYTLILLFIALVLSSKNPKGWGAMQYPQLVLGMIAIFIYVGVEVTIQSNMGALLKKPEFGAFQESHISHYISLYWGSLMIGRWTGAISVFNFNKRIKQWLTIIIPMLAFGLILLVNVIKGNSVNDLLIYPLCIGFLIVAFLYSKERPATMLLAVSVLATTAMIIGMLTQGKLATFAFISGGLFCSVMWPCIFALAVTGLGKYTSQGSAFLIMMILGGALIPPVQGAICDFDIIAPQGIAGMSYTHFSYIVAVFCFAYLIWHTLQTSRVLKKQGIDFNTSSTTTH